MLTSFVSLKVVARIIGPPGLALVGQFLNSITIVGAFSIGGISQGVTKYVAEYYDKPDAQKKVIGNALRIAVVCTAIVSCGIMIFARPLSQYIFKTDDYVSVIVLLGATLILYSVNTILIAALNGFKSFKKYISINITISVVGLLLSILLVLTLGVYGALLNCVVSQSVVLLITFFFISREPWIKNIGATATDWNIIRKLGGFSLMSLTSSLFSPLSQIAVRNLIVKKVSLYSAGIWEGMNRISGMYLLFVTTSIATFYLPRLSELKDPPLLKKEVLKTAKIVLPVLAIICMLIFFCRNIIIPILFTKDFFSMGQLFAAQMIGDFFKISSWLIAYLFWAKALVRWFIITEISFNLSFFAFASLGINYFGLQGVVYGYAINYMIYFIVMTLLFNKLTANYRL
jgi:PST family polysaccharide transporter